jgi:murein DD-endopeptidase MepM/ murein hydrolase activator NlpD
MTDVVDSIRRRAFGATALVLVVALLCGAAPAFSITEEEVEQARAEREAAAAERAAALSDLESAILRYEEINSEYQELTHRIGVLRSRIEEYEDDVESLRDAVRRHAVQAYMHGPERDRGLAMFESDALTQAVIARSIISAAVAEDAKALDDLVAATSEMERLRIELTEDGGRLAELRIEAEAVAARMEEMLRASEEELAAAETELATAEQTLAEQRRREEEERLRREAEEAARLREEEERRLREEAIRAALSSPAAQGVSESVTPGFICPVAGPSAFTDTWGAPRSGGRTHKGVDMMALRGTPLVAVADGVVEKSYGVLGGNIVWLYADHGVNYFYAHLDSYPEGMVHGQRVARGDVIGYVGDTGNPAPGAYHLHFGIYPGGVSAVNPYPTVARVCP